MTALGLAVAVPAVMQYNWLMRRNKAIVEELARFANDVHGYMMSGGRSVRPSTGASAPAPPRPPPAAPPAAAAPPPKRKSKRRRASARRRFPAPPRRRREPDRN
jgi:biopolymer transport protein ExbB